ncbi:hypothetical protein NUU61_008132 [Penicillium alfredii]|uniref:Uncharacterized protein n=1 Tax=Penicillium alfredii TaxID=1506179 RepID=A0A9W9ES29_9EURO|nr:uncharacterized protein NUU61_008132 [Penicillium alfredii]KAJ5086825.1 hypothetical protein NUU61_008132 [Penicillium alfredii]
MVVFVDLDQDALEHHGPTEKPFPLILAPVPAADPPELLPSPTSSEDEACASHPEIFPDVNPNRNAFSAALSCYPIVKEIARAVDLNTLHALSRTCRQFHVNLAPFRQQLVRETLRCENEYVETLAEMLDGDAVLPSSVKSVLQLLSRGSADTGRMTRGKVGKCARDMVGECRRCARPPRLTATISQNCTVKPPSAATLKNRIRRLCRTCGTSPLACHLSYRAIDPTDPLEDRWHADTAAAFARSACTCEDTVWLCTPCGQTLRSSDTTYRRVWAWRTRYSTYLGGGLGTGIGEGCQGVKCGRGEACLAAQEIELEVDCEADEGPSETSSPAHSPPGHPSHLHQHHHHHNSHHPDFLSTDSHDDEEPGYFRQEVIGLGGVVKHKAKKRVTVGACVVEYEDERETGRYLVREEGGLHRAWCGWCSRVIPAKAEA